MPFPCLRLISFSLASLLLASGFANPTVTIYPNKPLQRIDGFGASDAWYAPEIHSYNAATQTKILDALFSTKVGAGLSLLRHRVPYEIEPSAGVWDWTEDNDAIWLSQQAMARGVSQIWSSVWSPPAWMKTNNNVDNGGAVAASHYQDYATFLATYIQHYATSFGVTIAGISLANEPDQTQSYESSNWTGQEFHDFLANNLISTFKSANLQTKVMLPEISGWTDSLASQTLADPITSNFVGIINAHNYWGTLAPFSDAAALNKTVWETEVSNLGTDDPSITDGLSWAQVLHHTLVDAHANAWHYWWLYSNVGDTTGQSLISGDPTTNTISTKKRLWTIGNYSRFVRPGASMIGVSTNYPTGGVSVSAFLNTSGSVVVVAINSNAAIVNVTTQLGSPASLKATVYRTSASEDLALVREMPVGASGFVANLAAQSVTTFVLQPVAKP